MSVTQFVPRKRTHRSKTGTKGAGFLLIFVATFVLLILSTPTARGEEPETKVEGFSLYRYDKDEWDVSWKLSGKEANSRDGELRVVDFTLTIQPGKPKVKEEFVIDGEQIVLREREQGQIGFMSGEINFDGGENIRGTARNAVYYFRSAEVEGRNLKLTRLSGDEKIFISGTDFSYGFSSEKLKITGGFKVRFDPDKQGEPIITGKSLVVPAGGKLIASGELSIALDSGWRVTAEETSWYPSTNEFRITGQPRAKKDDTVIRGKSFKYFVSSCELRVISAKLRIGN